MGGGGFGEGPGAPCAGSARSGEIETPSPGLDPERFLSLDLGFRTEQEGWRLEVSAYHTIIDDMITRFPTGRVIDDELEVRKDNVGDGWVRPDLGDGVGWYGAIRIAR